MGDALQTCTLIHKALISIGLSPINMQKILTNQKTKNDNFFFDLFIKIILSSYIIYSLYEHILLLRQQKLTTLIVDQLLTTNFRGIVIVNLFSNLNPSKFKFFFDKTNSVDENLSKLKLKFDYKKFKKQLLLLFLISILRMCYSFFVREDFWLFCRQYVRLALALIHFQLCSYYWMTFQHIKLLNTFQLLDNGSKTVQLLWVLRIYMELDDIMFNLHRMFVISISMMFFGDMFYVVSVLYGITSKSIKASMALLGLIVPVFLTISIGYCYRMLEYEVRKNYSWILVGSSPTLTRTHKH